MDTLTALLVVGSALVAPSNFIPVAEAQVREPTLQEIATEVAREYEIPTSTLFNLVYSESRWVSTSTSSTGDYGLVQINLKYNPDVTEEEALDPVFALHFAASRIKKGSEHLWTACNCVSLVRSKVPSMPKMASIQPNGKAGVGKIAVFYYGKVKHVAYVTKVEAKGFWVLESNYEPCLIAKRFVSWGDRALEGFWGAGP